MSIGYEIIVIVIMLVFNAIFAAYEMALASISRVRIAILVSEKKKGANEAAFMKDRMEISLAIVQLGITLVGALAAATGGIGIEESFVPYLQGNWNIPEVYAEILAIIVLIVPLIFIIIIFSELIPKMLALNNNEWVVLKLSPIMKFLSSIAYPIIVVIETVVKKVVRLIARKFDSNLSNDKKQRLHELKTAVSLARTSMLLGAREEKIVLSAAHLSMRPVRDIIIPAQDISMLCLKNSLLDAFLKAHLDMHTRFPVCDEENNPQSIQGYVNFKDIIVAMKVKQAEPTMKGIMRPIKRIDENMSLSQLLEIMIQEKVHIVLVVSKENYILGMVTMEDIIEELVGEIEDEFDRLPTYIHPYGSCSWIMGGGVLMTVVASTVGFDWSAKFGAGQVPTLAEWSVRKIGRSLEGGEIIESDNICVIPRKFRRKKMSEAMVSIVT